MSDSTKPRRDSKKSRDQVERYEPDDSLEVIDTRPGRPVPKGRRDRRKMPLARLVATFVDPSDNWPVTLEVIVLTGARDDDHTATEADLPELQQVGWDDREIGPLKIFLRVVVA